MRSLVAPRLLLAVVLSGCASAAPAKPADYCAAAQANLEASAVLAGSGGSGFTPDVIEKIRSTNDAVVAAAPVEIRDGVEASAKISSALLDALERNGGDVTRAIADPVFVAASQAAGPVDPKVIDYAQNVCGLDIGAVTGS